jgi:glycosyltransferase involved in cell wall biosynthesis
MRKISFVIACFNSSQSISNVVFEIKETILKRLEYDYEIILVNDYSKDTTFEVINKLCENDTKILGISLSRNFGQQSAMLAGFSFASGELVAYCDDDGQSPVNDIYKLIDKLDEGYDMVWANFESKKNHWFKNVGSIINNQMVSFLLEKPKDLYFGNLWVAKKFVIEEACKCKNPFPYLGGLFLKITTNMANVYTKHRARVSGRSNYSFFKLLSIWLNGFTAFSIVPLRFASIIGAFISFLGFIFLIYLIVFRLLNPNVLIGYSSIMSVLLFIGGIQMLMMGLLGEYIGRIYINLNSVPQYVIKRVINGESK